MNSINFAGHLRLGAAALLIFASLAANPAGAPSPEDLKRLLDQGKPEEAYLLGRRSPERLGEPAFDFHYGIAAINSGKAAEGVLALERFLLAFPDHEAGRVELARGYFMLGEDARAREEFAAALARKPPPVIARAIGEYLDALREREAKYRPTAMAYFELGGGFDSNPRAGVDNATLTLPVLGEVTLLESGLRAGDQTRQYGAGFRLAAPLGPHTQAFAAGEAVALRYPDLAEFNQNVYSSAVGAQGKGGRLAWRAGATFGYQTLDQKPYRRTHGGFMEASTALGDRNSASAGLQSGQFDYEGANTVRDAHFRAASVGWKHIVAAPWRPEIEVSANAGREKNVFAERQDLSRDLYGARVGFACSPWTGWTVAVSALHQRSDYLEADPILQTKRADRYSAGDMSVSWAPWGALQVRAEFSSAKNDSNLAIYEYRRKTALLRVRYEFR